MLGRREYQVSVPRGSKPKYLMSLSVYPVSLCGIDLQKGKPLEVSAEGEDLYELKLRTDELIFSVVTESGECFIEMRVTENGEYCDCDEWWSYVNVTSRIVSRGGSI